MIASDEYWADESLRMPPIPLSSGLIDGFAGVHHFASHGAAKVMRLYSHAQRKGFEAEAIPVGRELPILERGEGLLRVVEDMRHFPLSDSLLSKLWNRMKVDNEPDDFDKLAERMRVDKLYRDETARLTVLVEGGNLDARIWRIVSYLTGSKSGSQLDGIFSSELSQNPSNVLMTYTLPPIVVGETYVRNSKGTGLSKIVTAEIVIPGSGSRARAPKKSKIKISSRPAFNF